MVRGEGAMKTEKQIRRAARLLGDLARKVSAEGDDETYEVVANIAVAIEWVIDGNPKLVVVTENLIRQAAISVQDGRTN